MINDSVASDVVRAIKGMGRGFKLNRQESRTNSEGQVTNFSFVSRELTDETPDRIATNILKQVIYTLSKLGHTNKQYVGEVGGRLENTKNDTSIQVEFRSKKGYMAGHDSLFIRVFEPKIKKDSKLYKIDNKIVKASSVSDAIKKMKDTSFHDYSELDQLLDNSSAARIFLNTLKHAGKISNMKQYEDYYEEPNIEFSYKFNITPQLEKQAYEKGQNTALGYMDWIAEMSGFRINREGVYTQVKIKNVNYVEEANAEFLDLIVRVSALSSASYIRKNGAVDPKAAWNNFKIKMKLAENGY